jgi:glyoxylase I family protein
MKIEHAGIQVQNPAAMADWYIAHLGFKCLRTADAPVPVRFIADDSGKVMLEAYNNPEVPVPDYAAMNPLHLHVAFVCDDPGGTAQRLIRAGAMLVSGPEIKPNGDELVMLRDPWGLPIQLCRRAAPMV